MSLVHVNMHRKARSTKGGTLFSEGKSVLLETQHQSFGSVVLVPRVENSYPKKDANLGSLMA